MNTGVYVSFWIMVFSGYVPRSGIVGSFFLFFSTLLTKGFLQKLKPMANDLLHKLILKHPHLSKYHQLLLLMMYLFETVHVWLKYLIFCWSVIGHIAGTSVQEIKNTYYKYTVFHSAFPGRVDSTFWWSLF